jgi:hypothetical protein
VLFLVLTRGGADGRDSAAPAPLGYVGRVEGTRAFVGVVVRGSDVMAYVCDGRKLARWFGGRLRDGRAVLRSASGEELELRLSDVARGTLRLPGREAASFVAVAAHGRAGLFRSERAGTSPGRPARVLTGWVRLNDGSLRGGTVVNGYRILRPTATVDVVLVAAPGGTAGPAVGLPGLELRQTAKPVPVCDEVKGFARDGKPVTLTTRGCGLPQAGAKPSTGPRVRVRPRDFPLPATVLATFAAGLDRFVARRWEAVFRLAGQRVPVLFSAAARSTIDGQATAMVKDARVLEAAEQFRRAQTNSLLDSMEGYRRAAQGYTDPVRELRTEGSPLVGLYTSGRLRPLGFPIGDDYTGPWAEVTDLATDGGQWETADGAETICHDFLPCSPVFRVLGQATNVEAQARAGFGSSVTYDKADLLTFDVPANAGQVQVELFGETFDVDVDTEDCFGTAWGLANWSYAIFRAGPGGTVDPLNDTAVTSLIGASYFDPDDGGLLPDDCVPRMTPPIPDPPQYDVLATGNDVLAFTAPPGGGTYVLAAMVQAHAEVFLGGTAVAQAALGLDRVTVWHH